MSQTRTPTRRTKRRADPSARCPRCGEYLTVAWRGRLWCILCDDSELFDERRLCREQQQQKINEFIASPAAAGCLGSTGGPSAAHFTPHPLTPR